MNSSFWRYWGINLSFNNDFFISRVSFAFVPYNNSTFLKPIFFKKSLCCYIFAVGVGSNAFQFSLDTYFLCLFQDRGCQSFSFQFLIHNKSMDGQIIIIISQPSTFDRIISFHLLDHQWNYPKNLTVFFSNITFSKSNVFINNLFIWITILPLFATLVFHLEDCLLYESHDLWFVLFFCHSENHVIVFFY